ncbi:hypothetical protein BCR32DRAFT_289978 [Anaeromyces robustus]|uniref:Gem-associated protein 7 n=1 Tax=Anaeromyces robustus TaxID=1754192 RepID=A0A1Y1XLI3_9FUNG|nr:hypothetical protein BCR32DRAFT_289978 [Anaeromyces robustus]|eukprot:ORX86555.1 hypothetical protein BCR32DRAFT_289978 [Anaeromyces robustus]
MENDTENSSVLTEMKELLAKKQDQLIKYNLRKRFLNLNLFLAKQTPTIELNMYTNNKVKGTFLNYSPGEQLIKISNLETQLGVYPTINIRCSDICYYTTE